MRATYALACGPQFLLIPSFVGNVVPHILFTGDTKHEVTYRYSPHRAGRTTGRLLIMSRSLPALKVGTARRYRVINVAQSCAPF